MDAVAPATPPRSALTAQLAALPADDLIDGAVVGVGEEAGAASPSFSSASSASSSAPPSWSPRSALNEVVCGALMAALERAGQARPAVRVLDRARALGIAPNAVMHNTALAALGRVGRWREAEALFNALPDAGRDGVTHETLVAAYGLAGQADRAEAALARLVAAGHGPPRDYAWVALIAAHSVAGDVRSALGVRDRMAAAGVAPTVHVFNALLAACERAQRWEAAVSIQAAMAAAGVPGDALTARLLAAVGRGGVSAVEDQQLAAAALSAALAAAGGLIMRAGFF
jgi:pentatricopeptide repeat protein